LAVIEVKLFKREGEQRQRIAWPGLEVRQEPVRKCRVDVEISACLYNPARWPSITSL
jgi:hypothetical protein